MCGLLVVSWAAIAAAAVKVPAVIGDNLVLQRGQPVPIWGWADKGEAVTVSIAGQTLTAKTGDDGRWKVVLAKLEVGQPLEMTIKGSSGSAITVRNILVGDVWVCSGQSNMEMYVSGCNDAQREIAAAKHPNIRLFTVAAKKAAEPQADCAGQWNECSPATVPGFSAVAYFFGRQLHQDLGVPIGLIGAYWGGTPADLWTSRKALEANPALKSLAGVGENSFLYNGMIAPLIPYAIRGAIWYQGESNQDRAFQYRTLFPAMIANWRADWGQGGFPFGFVQLAPFRYNEQNPIWAELCEAQRMTLNASPNTGMAVTTDIGDLKNIHPKNKQDVGRRLALWALAKVYGKDIVYSGPIYKSMTTEGNKIRLQFDHVGGGLMASNGQPLVDFAIAGADQKFVLAGATIDGASIIVSSGQVAEPVAVRYAWHDDTQPNLANKEGLPASPFRTDTWKGVTEPMPRQAESAWTVGDPIVAYWAGPGYDGSVPLTDAVAEQMVDVGINVVWAASTAEVDLAGRHGLRAIYQNRALFQPQNLDDPILRPQLDAKVDELRHQPGLYGYYIVDEPCFPQFAGLGRLVDYLRKRDPSHMARINLLPLNAFGPPDTSSVTTEGVASYATYLDQFVSTVQPSLLSYDCYDFRTSDGKPYDGNSYLANLAQMSQQAKSAGLPFMNIVQACKFAGNVRIPTGHEERFLAYTTLAYGAQGIMYYVWCWPGHEGGIVKPDGTPTAIYNTLKATNREFVAIAKQYQPLKSLGAYLKGYSSGHLPPGTTQLPGNSPFNISSVANNLTYSDGAPLKGVLFGLFGQDGTTVAEATFALVTNLDYTANLTCTVTGPGSLSVFNATTGVWTATGHHYATLDLPPGGGALVGLTVAVPEPATTKLPGTGYSPPARANP